MELKSKIRELVKAILPFNWVYGKKAKKILQSHQEVAGYWDAVIEEYQKGDIVHHTYSPKASVQPGKVIWQYWGQGVKRDELPEVVRTCFDSVDKYAGDFEVIRLTDNTIRDYLDVPEEILQKVQSGEIRRVFFSDLLRVMLLATYGGIWLDATILMTDAFPKEFMVGDHFCYQRDSRELYKNIWEKSFIYYFSWHPDFQVNMLSSILWAKPGSEMMTLLSDLLQYYWLHEAAPKEYFFFQILYNRLVTGDYQRLRPQIVSDCPPHILHMLVRGARLPYTSKYALEHSTLHKLTYFTDREMDRMNQLLSK